MEEILWHADIRLPDGFVAPIDRVAINYGSHARREALSDRYGKIHLPASLTLGRFDVIEVGTIGGKVSKILFRGILDLERDLCIVLVPNKDGEPWFCKTVWVNLATDTHGTLDRSRYVR
jgi:hypothetical protein